MKTPYEHPANFDLFLETGEHAKASEYFCMTTPHIYPAQPEAWIIRESRYVIDTAHLRIRADCVELPSGKVVDEYFVRESRGYAVIFALTKDQRVLLVRQYKHGIGREVLELPAGGIDPDESPEACAIRELAEETGHRGDPPEFIASFITDPTGSNARFHLFLIRNAELQQAQDLDPTELITVELATIDEVHAMVRDGRIDVAPQVTGILTVLDRRAAGSIRI